jgi:hypothetical protein
VDRLNRRRRAEPFLERVAELKSGTTKTTKNTKNLAVFFVIFVAFVVHFPDFATCS